MAEPEQPVAHDNRFLRKLIIVGAIKIVVLAAIALVIVAYYA
jgi:hypothetical protein